jgi:uncharacterized protein (DUF983 family)
LTQYDQLTFAAAGALQLPVPALTEVDEADEADVPTAFVAVTLKAYAVPVVSPVTVILPDPDWVRVPVIPPGNDVALYDVIAEPPLAGAVNETVIVVGPVEVNAVITGALGAIACRTEADHCEAVDVPTAFVAVTLNRYVVPVESPLTVILPDPAWVRVPVIPPGSEVAV